MNKYYFLGLLLTASALVQASDGRTPKQRLRAAIEAKKQERVEGSGPQIVDKGMLGGLYVVNGGRKGRKGQIVCLGKPQ